MIAIKLIIICISTRWGMAKRFNQEKPCPVKSRTNKIIRATPIVLIINIGYINEKWLHTIIVELIRSIAVTLVLNKWLYQGSIP
jgi:hypothetical protein